MSRRVDWPRITDKALVERMIPAVQRAIVEGSAPDDQADNVAGVIGLAAPDVANVLLMVLATILEQASDCATPQGTRLTAEAAGRELANLIRDVRRLKLAGSDGTNMLQ